MKTKARLKRLKNSAFLKWLKITLAAGLIASVFFLIISAVIFLCWFIVGKFGVTPQKKFSVMLIYDLAAVTLIVGSITSALLLRYPIAWIADFKNAFDEISSGNYNVRLPKNKVFKGFNPVIENFNKMTRQLSSTETLSHDFISNFSHECKTPIASINGFAKVLKDENLTKEQRSEYIDIIINESEMLSGLANNILSLSRFENQTILTDKSAVNISEQIRIVIGRFYSRWSSKSIEISFDSDDFYISGNSDMLDIVWSNIIDNAIKYSPDSSTISIDIKRAKADIIITVTNTGISIENERAERIFDKFYQCEESHSAMGNGLGLAIVKRIVKLHEGDIRFVPSEGNETTFEITLPVQTD